MRLAIRVQPGGSRTEVGGRWGEEEPPVLLVRVRERAVEGRANDAVVRAVADAFGVHRSAVAIVGGVASRRKALLLDGDPDVLGRRLADLLG